MTARIPDEPGTPPGRSKLPRIRSLEAVGGEIKEFRRKPIVIKAVELPFDAVIVTFHGEARAQKGDFIILDEKGSVYPCEKSIFQLRHESGEAIVCLDCGTKYIAFPGQMTHSAKRCWDCFKADTLHDFGILDDKDGLQKPDKKDIQKERVH